MEQYVGEGQDLHQGHPHDGEASSSATQDEGYSFGLAHGGVWFILVTTRPCLTLSLSRAATDSYFGI